MKAPKLCLKLAALVSSVLLGGSWVAYRAGAFSPRPTTTGAPHTADLVSIDEVIPVTQVPTTGDAALFYSSKSLAPAIAPSLPAPSSSQPAIGSQQSATPIPQQTPTLLPGSKSMFIPTPIQQGNAPPPPPGSPQQKSR